MAFGRVIIKTGNKTKRAPALDWAGNVLSFDENLKFQPKKVNFEI